jgi:REP element-mobilizing transposase RayT
MAGRKLLPHTPPCWIDPAQETWFITVCCEPRGVNQLARPEVAPEIFESVAHRNETRVWWTELFLLMPDHCHALMSFPQGGLSIPKTIADWKRWLARQPGIQWQRDFFDHRLRHDESALQKADYIMNNPVRAGLVAKAEDWPYWWKPGR